MRAIRTLGISLTLLIMLLLTACGSASVGVARESPAAMPTAAPAAQAPAGGADGSTNEAQAIEEYAGEATTGQSSPQPQNQQRRLVIKNAFVSIQVEAVTQAEATLRARAEQLGGYMVSVQTNGSDQFQTATIVFRVPAERFEEALSGVEGLAKKVLSRNVSGDDVTEEFVDLESRLRNLEATRDRLLDLLSRADEVEDALQVNQALSDVQGEIEQIRGRMQYLQQSAAFSTISVDLQPVPPTPAIIEDNGWDPLRAARLALRDLVEFGQGLVEFVIVVLVWSPVWLPIVLIGMWAWRRFVRPRPKTTPPTPPAPIA
ncbi:MAG: DUF4349 domain-containing protein [Oscillochloris sp.]|nr:DUF4349 domain-containing protein [Oscillochloris sp.]